MKNNDRFEVILKEGSSLSEAGRIHVLVDKETGVNYLWVVSGYAGGLTPLLEADGRPIITK
jgi:hypothetical protein